MALMIRGKAFRFGSSPEAPEASVRNYLNFLEEHSGQSWPILYSNEKDAAEFERKIYVKTEEGFFYAIVESKVRREIQHKQRTDADGNPVIKAIDIEDKISEVSFICMKIANGKGIYATYKGACSFSLFLHNLWNDYKEFVADKKNIAIEGLRGKSLKNAQKKFALKGKKNVGAIYESGSYEDLIEQLNYVKNIAFISYNPENSECVRDICPFSKKISLNITVEEEKTGVLAGFINRFRDSSVNERTGSHHGNVSGLDGNGNDRIVDFENTVPSLYKKEYDLIGDVLLNRIEENMVLKEIKEQVIGSVLFNDDA